MFHREHNPHDRRGGMTCCLPGSKVLRFSNVHSRAMFARSQMREMYLEARKWNTEKKAKEMLVERLVWKSSYKIEGEEVAAVEGEKERSVLILRPATQNTVASLDSSIRHLVLYLIENAILNLPEDQEQMSGLTDSTGQSLSTSLPIKSAMETVNILQNHYPGG